MILTNPKERARFLRFSVVGTIGAVVDFGTFNLVHSLAHVPPIIARMISFSAAVASNFIWNRYWTYPESRSKSITRQLTQFFIVNLIGLAINTSIFAGLETPLRKMFAALETPLPISSDLLGYNLALAIGVGVVLLWNFFINRFWTYNDIEQGYRRNV
jgi:putative flippase GtrA